MIKKLPWSIVLIACATLGLAPFNPPHIIQKLILLTSGNLEKSIDIFDLLMHGSPWIFLFIKIVIQLRYLKKKP